MLAGVRDPDAFEPIAGAPRSARSASTSPSRESIDALRRRAIDLPPVDLLVNNAGQMTGGLLEEQDMDAVYAMFQVNLVAVAHLTAACCRGMLARGRGTIVNNASISGYAYFPAASTYAASKAGVVALSESLRRELERHRRRRPARRHARRRTPTCSTPPRRSTAATWTPRAGTRSSPRSGRDKVARRDRGATSTSSAPAARLAFAKLASRGPAFLLDALSGRMFSRQPR